MRKPPVPANEKERLEDVWDLQMLDTPPEEPFDGIVEIAASLFEAPVALITLIDNDRQWFKASVGSPISFSSRELAFCSHTIMAEKTMVVEDMTCDARFYDHPFVTGRFGLRFYAGTPLISARRQCVGTVCVLDVKPRVFESTQRRYLERLARQAMDAFEMRRLVRILGEGCLKVGE